MLPVARQPHRSGDAAKELRLSAYGSVGVSRGTVELPATNLEGVGNGEGFLASEQAVNVEEVSRLTIKREEKSGEGLAAELAESPDG